MLRSLAKLAAVLTSQLLLLEVVDALSKTSWVALLLEAA